MYLKNKLSIPPLSSISWSRHSAQLPVLEYLDFLIQNTHAVNCCNIIPHQFYKLIFLTRLGNHSLKILAWNSGINLFVYNLCIFKEEPNIRWMRIISDIIYTPIPAPSSNLKQKIAFIDPHFYRVRNVYLDHWASSIRDFDKLFPWNQNWILNNP